MKRTLIFIAACLLAVACDSKNIPKSQDRDGNCNKAFLEAYNKVQGSTFEVQQLDNKETQAALSTACQDILKTYGTESEACLATDLSTGTSGYLSTKDIRETCAKSMKSKVFSGPPDQE
jgi:hypothetical protein